MQRILTSVLCVTLGFVAPCATMAEEIEWRAASLPTPKVDPPAMPADGVWRSARGQSPDGAPTELPLPRSTAQPVPASLPEGWREVKPIPTHAATPAEMASVRPASRRLLHPREKVLVQPQPFQSPELEIVDEGLFGLGVGRSRLPDGFGRDGFFSAEYLLWWVTPAKVPPLATTNFNGNQPIIGNPGTVILGPDEFGAGARSGARFRGGLWFDDCHSCGMDASFFLLGPVSECETFDSTRFPKLGRPFFAGNNFPAGGFPGPFIESVAFPDESTGTFKVKYDSFLWGGDVNFRECLCTTCDTHAEAFVGFRYLNLDESLEFRENLTALGGNRQGLPAGTAVTVFDQFQTESRFYGAQLGARYERYFGRMFVDARASLALGVNQNVVDVQGNATLTQPGMNTVSAVGGLLALDSNIGRRTHEEFSVSPEVTLNVGYQMTDRFRFFGGYNFLYWSNVVRPGDQIDTTLDVNRIPFFLPANVGAIPGIVPPRPMPLYETSDFWAMGLNMGFEYRW